MINTLSMHGKHSFRWGGISGDYELTAKDWQEQWEEYGSHQYSNPFMKCSCCGKVFDDKEYIYSVPVFVSENCSFKNICKECAYTAPETIEADGTIYTNDTKNIIEIDADGVLLDVYTPAEEYLKNLGYDFCFERDITSYSMSELGEKREIVLKALTEPECRKAAFPYFGAQQFLKELSDFAKFRPVDIVIHTSEYNRYCVPIKKQILRQLIGPLPIKIDVCLGDKKMYPNSVLVIEDCLDNLDRSDAPYKICFAHSHNKESQYFRTSDYGIIMDRIIEIGTWENKHESIKHRLGLLSKCHKRDSPEVLS